MSAALSGHRDFARDRSEPKHPTAFSAIGPQPAR
jgi:hypothetical protein